MEAPYVEQYMLDGFVHESRVTRDLATCRAVFDKPELVETATFNGKDMRQLTPDFAARLGAITVHMPDGAPLSAVAASDLFQRAGFDEHQYSSFQTMLNRLEEGRHGEPRETLGEVRRARAADLLQTFGIDEWDVAFLEHAIRPYEAPK